MKSPLLDSDTMKCTQCGKVTTVIEARTRIFNTFGCAFCDGTLEPFDLPGNTKADIAPLDSTGKRF